MKISRFMVLLSVPVLFAGAGAAPLHSPGAVVSTKNNFGVGFETDSDLTDLRIGLAPPPKGREWFGLGAIQRGS
jgi:hypothetical protein